MTRNEGVLRIDPPVYCGICQREVRVSDRAVVLAADDQFHADCFADRRRHEV